MPILPEVLMMRQEDGEFKASLSYMEFQARMGYKRPCLKKAREERNREDLKEGS